MDEKFNFRGAVSDSEEFYMLAVLKKEQGATFRKFGEFTTLGVISDKYFFLCQNQYIGDNNKNFHRLYWSCDPDDFQENKCSGFNNQGAVRCNISKQGSSTFLKYRTSFSGQHITSGVGKLENFGNNLNSLTGSEGPFPTTFTPKYSKNLNITSLYYSLPYDISNSNSLTFQTPSSIYNSIEWVFRKNDYTSSTTHGLAVSKPTTNPNHNNVFSFVDIGSMDSASGTSSSNFNYGSVRYTNVATTLVTEFTATTPTIKVDYKPAFNNFPHTNGLINITEGTESSLTTGTVVKYFKMVKNNNQTDFIIKDPAYSIGLTGSPTTIESGKDVIITLNERNHPDCFNSLSSGAQFSTYFDIYLIPSEEYAYFPGGYQIKNSNIFPTSCLNNSYEGNSALTPVRGINTLRFYSPNSRKPFTSSEAIGTHDNHFIKCSDNKPTSINEDKLNKYKKIYNLLLFYTLGSLQPSVWKLSEADTTKTIGMPAYPSIAEYTVPLTFYAWNQYSEANSAYMFDYCELDATCGRCFGKNNKGESICHADFLTRKNAATTSSKNVKNPLTTGRYTGSHSEHQMPVWQIGTIAAGSLLAVIFTGYLFHKLWKERELKKTKE